MHGKKVQVMAAIAVASMTLFGCSSDGSDGAPSTTEAPAEAATDGAATDSTAAGAAACAEEEADRERAVFAFVVEGSQISAQSPPTLTSGTVRIEADGDTENTEPVVVVVSLDGEPVRELPAVAPGEQCGVDIDLDPGTYEITSPAVPGLSAEFEVVAGS